MLKVNKTPEEERGKRILTQAFVFLLKQKRNTILHLSYFPGFDTHKAAGGPGAGFQAWDEPSSQAASAVDSPQTERASPQRPFGFALNQNGMLSKLDLFGDDQEF